MTDALFSQPLSPEDQTLIERIKAKIRDGRSMTTMQERWQIDADIYPLATAAEIAQAEAVLGFPLPPLIRAIWRQIGNGGFGPGYGITGVETGYRIYESTLIENAEFLRQAADYLRDEAGEAAHYIGQGEEQRQYAEELRREAADWYCGDRFIMYAYWGCNVTTVVDCALPDLPVHAVDGTTIQPHTSGTLRQWWLDWLEGRIEQY